MNFNEILENAPKNHAIVDTLLKARAILERHRVVAVSVSGGADSDCMLDLLELVKPADCSPRYVYFDTGLEFAATARHLDELERKYGVTIERRHAKVTVAAACAKHGVPFISKDASAVLGMLQRHGFDWRDNESDAAPEKYGRCKSALDWYFDRRPPSKTGKASFSIRKYAMLRDFLTETPPYFAISEKCCKYAKKDVSKEFERECKPDLNVNGMRRAEGGRRAGSVQTCFSPSKDGNADNYRPLWYWTDADKALYKAWRGLRYSDCYEVWNFKRTGCAGCPCNSKAEQELDIVEQFEPKIVQAARNIFGASYKYKRQFTDYKNTRRKQND